MNYLAFASLLIFFTSLINAAFVFLPPRNLLKTMWGIVSLLVGVIGVYLYLLLTASDEQTAYRCSLTLNTVLIFIPVFFFHFTLLLTSRAGQKKPEIVIYYLITLMYWMVIMVYPRSFIPGVAPVLSIQYYCQSGPLFYFLPFWFIYLMGYGLVLVFRSYRNASMIKRNQLWYFFIGCAFGLIGGISALLPAMNVPIYPWGIYLLPLNLLIVAYAIVKHQLMDIYVVLRKAFIYLLLLPALVFFFFGFLETSEKFLTPVLGFYAFNLCFLIAVVLVALILVPFYRLVEWCIDRIFYQQNSQLQQDMLAAERYKSLREICSSLAEEIKAPLGKLKEQSYNRGLSAEVEFIDDVTRQLKEYSQPLSTDFSSINVIEILEELTKDVQAKLADRKSTVFKYYQADDVVKVLGHYGQLKRALFYLFDHCLQVLRHDDGDVFITIEHDNKWASISIRHSGKGLTAQQRDEFFMPFFKSSQFKCGLGILLAESIIVQHGGKITLESEVDSGTEFLIEVPLI